eukprot:1144549-Pelagomonas_calceolata.AAC.2
MIALACRSLSSGCTGNNELVAMWVGPLMHRWCARLLNVRLWACPLDYDTQVGIFDADVYGPSVPSMISPSKKILEMNEETKVSPIQKDP